MRTLPVSTQVLHHVLKKVLKITTDERVSFSKWMEYNDYIHIHELCEGLPCRLKDLHEYSDYILDGQHFALMPLTMHKIKLLIGWMSTRKKETTIQLSSQYFVSLTYQDFQKVQARRKDQDQ